MGLFGSIFGWIFGKGKSPRSDLGGDAASGIDDIKRFKPETLIVGLGNPESKYDGTRHNIGFDVIDGLIDETANEVSDPAECCEAFVWMAHCGENRKPVLLAKPLTYMNLSGDALSALLRKFGLTPDKCLVIVDDFNIPLGKLRFRKDGSHGGHNGLKSISAMIGDGYPRLRVGIGPLPKGVSIINFVLGKFCEQELDDVKKVVGTATEAVMFMVENGIEAAMNKHNR